MPPLRPAPCFTLAAFFLALLPVPAHAWGRDGHRIINRLAIEFLPTDIPAFLRDGKAANIVEYEGPEPDHWRNHAEDELASTQAPDHFLDLEWADLAGTPCTTGSEGCSPTGTLLPRNRYDYIRALAAAQAKHTELPLQPEKVGMQPWQVEEIWQRLKSDLRDFRRLQAANEDLSGIEIVILFETGWLGHYVADGSQPLHTTINYNGWAERANPNGYTAEHGIHSQFESVYVSANIRPADVAPLVAASNPVPVADEWTQYLGYLRHSNSLVRRTYQVDKAGGFNGTGTPEAKQFTEERLAAGAIELRNLIYSAWIHSADPVQEFHGAQ